MSEDEKSEIRSMLWFPLVLGAVTPVLLGLFGAASDGLGSLSWDLLWVGPIFAGVGYMLVLPVVVHALLKDRSARLRAERTRQEAPRRRRVLADELGALHGANPQALRRLRRSIVIGNYSLIVVTVCAIPFLVGAAMFALWYAWHEMAGLLSPEWQKNLGIVGWSVATALGLSVAIPKIRGLAANPCIAVAVVTELGSLAPAGDPGDAALNWTGFNSLEMELEIEEAWVLTREGLNRLGWNGVSTVTREADVAEGVAVGERAVLVLAGGRVVGRLSDYWRVASDSEQWVER